VYTGVLQRQRGKTQGSEKMMLQHVETDKTVACAATQASTDQWTLQTDSCSSALSREGTRVPRKRARET